MSKQVPITFDHAVTLFEGDGVTHDEKGLVNTKVAPGAAWWTRNGEDHIAVLMYACPCGCSHVDCLPVLPGYSNTFWHWDQNETQPTLTPSVLRMSGCKWHGYLTRGVWTQC